MTIEKAHRRIAVVVAGMVLLTTPLPAFSQSCALCYTQAASATSRFIEALRSGILILVIPPMFMSVGITVLAYRKRNQFRNVNHSEESDGIW
jgi:hypothetical protein